MLTLVHHPAHSPAIPMAVEASIALQSDHTVVFIFRCRYQPDDQHSIGIELPAPTAPAECDHLWQHTCCEAFVSVPDADDYLEFNFSPSGCWAAYRFSDYRVRDEAFQCVSAPQIDFKHDEHAFELTAIVPSSVFWAQWPDHQIWQIGLSAVIETTGGHKTYWAMRHDDIEKPDFHLRTACITFARIQLTKLN